MTSGSAVAPVTLAMLKSLHQAHLRGGAHAIAAAVIDLAQELGVTPDAVVRGVRVCVTATSPETAGWAESVIPYVDGALEAGALDFPVSPPTTR